MLLILRQLILVAAMIVGLVGCKAEISGRKIPDEPVPVFSGFSLASFQEISLVSPATLTEQVKFIGNGGLTLGVSVPELAEDALAPLIIALHFSDGNGPDYLQYSIEPAFASLGAIILSPTVPKGTTWQKQSNLDMLRDLIDLSLAQWPVDPAKIAVVGYSMGGTGAWSVATQYPTRVQTVIGMASNPAPYIDALSPAQHAFIIHPELDTSVSVSELESLFNKMNARGINTRMEVVDGARHADWDLASSALLVSADWLGLEVWKTQ